MIIELTPLQQQALDNSHGVPVLVVDPRTNAIYVLVPADAAVTVTPDDKQVQTATRSIGMQNATRRAKDAD
jgi:hypothetical protein